MGYVSADNKSNRKSQTERYRHERRYEYDFRREHLSVLALSENVTERESFQRAFLRLERRIFRWVVCGLLQSSNIRCTDRKGLNFNSSKLNPSSTARTF